MSRAQNPYAFQRPEHNLHFTEKNLLNVFTHETVKRNGIKFSISVELKEV